MAKWGGGGSCEASGEVTGAPSHGCGRGRGRWPSPVASRRRFPLLGCSLRQESLP